MKQGDLVYIYQKSAGKYIGEVERIAYNMTQQEIVVIRPHFWNFSGQWLHWSEDVHNDYMDDLRWFFVDEVDIVKICVNHKTSLDLPKGYVVDESL
jgi:hypothetical protein